MPHEAYNSYLRGEMGTSEMVMRGHLIDIQWLPSIKISPTKVQKHIFITAILQTGISVGLIYLIIGTVE